MDSATIKADITAIADGVRLGNGDTAQDIQGFAIGTADLSGAFRAERAGIGAGRIYALSELVERRLSVSASFISQPFGCPVPQRRGRLQPARRRHS